MHSLCCQQPKAFRNTQVKCRNSDTAVVSFKQENIVKTFSNKLKENLFIYNHTYSETFTDIYVNFFGVMSTWIQAFIVKTCNAVSKIIVKESINHLLLEQLVVKERQKDW